MPKYIVDVYRWSPWQQKWVLCWNNCPQNEAFFEFKLARALYGQCSAIVWKEVK